MIQGKLQARYNNAAEMELRIKNMQHLSEVREKMTKQVNLCVPLSLVSNEWVGQLDALLSSNKGGYALKVHVQDEQTGRTLSLTTRKMTVNANNDFFDALTLLGVHFSLNSKPAGQALHAQA